MINKKLAAITTTKIKLTLVKSTAKCLPKHKLCIQGLGLRRLHHSVEVLNTPANQGMINKVIYLLIVKES